MGTFQCPECSYQYIEARGDIHEGLQPGVLWGSLPVDFTCPSCAVRSRDDFISVTDDPSPTF